MYLKTKLSWRAKIAAKLILSRLPATYTAWRRLNLFRHGHMDDPGYALEVFRRHFACAGDIRPLQNFTCLELGPGDSLLSAVIARAYGARQTWLVDVGPFAEAAVEPYLEIARRLRAEGLPVPDLTGAKTRAEVMTRCHAEYRTQGLAALSEIAAQSVDFAWSHAVLEHVRRAEFGATMAETFRVLKPGGVASHCVDLRDHLGGSLNNLRFSETWWEKESTARSGFYTNRIRYSEMLHQMCDVGFEVTVVEKQSWPFLPTPRERLDPAFRGLPDDELNVSAFSVVLIKPEC